MRPRNRYDILLRKDSGLVEVPGRPVVGVKGK